MSVSIITMLVGVLATVTVTVGAGCGSGDDSSLTKSEFVKRADGICKEQESKKNASLIEAYERAAAENRDGKKVQEDIIIGVALPPISKMIEELKDLGSPNGEEEKAHAMIDAFEEEIENIEADPAGTVAGRVGNFDEANKIAREFGLEACSAV